MWNVSDYQIKNQENMKKLICMVMAVMLLTVVGCRRHKTIQYVRVAPDSVAEAANDIPKAGDPLESIDNSSDWSGDDDGLIAIPDIPQERPVNMRANDSELRNVMKGGKN